MIFYLFKYVLGFIFPHLLSRFNDDNIQPQDNDDDNTVRLDITSLDIKSNLDITLILACNLNKLYTGFTVHCI